MEQRHQMVRLRDRDLHWFGLLAGSQELTDIMLRGYADLSALTTQERARFDAMLLNAFVTNAFYMRLREQNAIDEAQYEAIDRAMGTFVRQPGVAQWWQTVREGFTTSYRARVDGWVEGGEPSVVGADSSIGNPED